MKRRRQALLLAINSAAAFVFTFAGMGPLSKVVNSLPPKIAQTIWLKVIHIIWPILAIELLLCATGVILFLHLHKMATKE